MTIFDDIRNHDLSGVKKHLRNKTDLCALEENKTPIQHASDINFWGAVIAMAESHQASVCDKENYGYALVLAVKNNSEQAQKAAIALIKAKASFIWRCPNDLNYALHWVVQNNNVNLLGLLIDRGDDLNHKNINKQTPFELALALLPESWDCIITIANKQKVNEHNKDQYERALLAAIKADNPLAMQALIDAGVDASGVCEALNESVQTSLESACISGKWKSAEILKQADSCKISNQANAAKALVNTIKANKLDLAECLVKAGASCDEKVQPEGYTALHQAVVDNNFRAVKFLLANGASQTITSPEHNDETPIELACKLGHWDIAQKLIEAASVKNENKKQASLSGYERALRYTIRGGNYSIAKLLLENHADCNYFCSDHGTQSLYFAIINARPDLVSLLMAHGADPDVRNKDGETSYDFAKRKDKKCLAALHFDNIDYLTELDVTTLTEKAEASFQQLQDNGILANDISAHIKRTQAFDEALLKKMVIALQTKRNDLGNKNSTLSTHAMLAIQSQKDNFTSLIQTINFLLNSPNYPIPFNKGILCKMQEQGINEAANLLAYLDRKEKRQDYIGRLQHWLMEFKQNLLTRTWTIKNFWGNWVHGQPQHVTHMLVDLENLSIASNPGEVLDVYKKIMDTLINMPKSSRRHPDTTQYYQGKITEIKNIHFNDAAYEYSFVPATPSYTPTCTPSYTSSCTPSYTLSCTPVYTQTYTQSALSSFPVSASNIDLAPPCENNLYPALNDTYIPPHGFANTGDNEVVSMPANVPIFQPAVRTQNVASHLTDTQYSSMFPPVSKTPLIYPAPAQEYPRLEQEQKVSAVLF